MFMIGEAVIEDNVGNASFCCDLAQCRGACCTLEGGRGAPLEDLEVEQIRTAYSEARMYLRDVSIRLIDEKGIVEGTRGDYATPCIDDRECAYVFFDRGIAKCSFERAYLEGRTAWRKPISCHLFPVRVRSFGHQIVRYEEMVECAPGRVRGEKERVMLHDFLREPLTRKFGKSWYEEFARECRAQGWSNNESN